MARQRLPVLQERSIASVTMDIGGEERAGRLVALGRALSTRSGRDVEDARRRAWML